MPVAINTERLTIMNDDILASEQAQKIITKETDVFALGKQYTAVQKKS